MGEHTYLIRYGVMGQVGRFVTLPGAGAQFERGDIVVIQSHRGLELGEILIPHDSPASARSGGDHPPASGNGQKSGPAPGFEQPRVLRLAGQEDLACIQIAQEKRANLLTLCQRVLEEENWPCELIDVELLLDGSATVLHYLGPQQMDVSLVRARFRGAYGLDVVLQPAGTDLDRPAELDERAQQEGDRTGCGSCDCGAGGGCGTATAPRAVRGTQSAASSTNPSIPSPHAGCATCGISLLLAARSRKNS